MSENNILIAKKKNIMDNKKTMKLQDILGYIMGL